MEVLTSKTAGAVVMAIAVVIAVGLHELYRRKKKQLEDARKTLAEICRLAKVNLIDTT